MQRALVRFQSTTFPTLALIESSDSPAQALDSPARTAAKAAVRLLDLSSDACLTN